MATRAAASVPVPMPYSGLASIPWKVDAYVDSGVAPPTTRAFATGDTSTVPSGLNQNAVQLDLSSTYASGMVGIAKGLTGGTSGSLVLTIASGAAIIGGVVEKKSGGTITLPNNQANVYVWLKQDGTLTYELTTTPPASTSCCFLGTATTSGGAITAWDDSGVCKLIDGQMWRETGDTGKPADTPSANSRFYSLSSGGSLWWWDGTGYRLVPSRTGQVLINKTLPLAETLYVPSGWQGSCFNDFTVEGTLDVDGEFLIPVSA